MRMYSEFRGILNISSLLLWPTEVSGIFDQVLVVQLLQLHNCADISAFYHLWNIYNSTYLRLDNFKHNILRGFSI